MSAVPLLRLLQLFDSQFPVGAFAHSGGIETYASLGAGVADLREILHAQISLGWGRSELAAAHLAWRAAKGDSHLFGAVKNAGDFGSGDKGDCHLLSLARRVDALKVVPAVRNASIGLGRRTVELLRRLYPDAAIDVDPAHHAVVIGAATRRLGIGVETLLPAYAHSLAMGTLAAALRCMAVSPAQTQALLIEVHEPLAQAAARALTDPEACLSTCTPALDIRSHEQAFLRTRLFQS